MIICPQPFVYYTNMWKVGEKETAYCGQADGSTFMRVCDPQVSSISVFLSEGGEHGKHESKSVIEL